MQYMASPYTICSIWPHHIQYAVYGLTIYNMQYMASRYTIKAVRQNEKLSFLTIEFLTSCNTFDFSRYNNVNYHRITVL